MSRTNGTRTEASTTNDAEQIGYVQGMNVLCGPFLYASRSEVEAFTGFEKLITSECPGYVRGSMEGVHKGLALVDRVLEVVDQKLYAHLMAHRMEARIWAFASVLTMCACTPPLTEVLRLWDFLFAYGPHLNILCIVAQLVLIRTSILESTRHVHPSNVCLHVADHRQPKSDPPQSAQPRCKGHHRRCYELRRQDPRGHVCRDYQPRQIGWAAEDGSCDASTTMRFTTFTIYDTHAEQFGLAYDSWQQCK